MQAFGTHRLDDEIGRAGPHGRDHVVDAAMGGLDDNRGGHSGLAHLREHAEPVEFGHDEIEHHAVDAPRIRTVQRLDGGIAALDRDRRIAGALEHVLEQPALHRIVVDDKDRLGHCGSFECVPNRANVAGGP